MYIYIRLCTLGEILLKTSLQTLLKNRLMRHLNFVLRSKHLTVPIENVEMNLIKILFKRGWVEFRTNIGIICKREKLRQNTIKYEAKYRLVSRILVKMVQISPKM